MSTSQRTLNCALVGLGFGTEFIPIYLKHPYVDQFAICDLSDERRNRIGEGFAIERRFKTFDDVLTDPAIDCVHLTSGIFDHAWMAIAALKAGKHVMSTVPMATTIEECEEIVATVEATGLKYMMAETVVYGREFLYVQELYRRGELGNIQYMQASHTQNMAGWPDYWERMSPMLYTTHVVGPILGLVNGRAEYVSCFGSGAVNDYITARSGNRYAVESCNIKINDMDLSAHIWRFLYDTARQYRESFDVYGTLKSFEWALTLDGEHIMHTAGKKEREIPETIAIPDYAHLLPQEIQHFTKRVEDPAHLSFVQGGGHGGSHPHLVHAFLSAIVNDTQPWPDAKTAANWTCVGICAHQSTQRGGERVYLPEFTL